MCAFTRGPGPNRWPSSTRTHPPSTPAPGPRLSRFVPVLVPSFFLFREHVQQNLPVVARTRGGLGACDPISFGSPHVHPTGAHRTCGEPDEIKKIPTRTSKPDVFVSPLVKQGTASKAQHTHTLKQARATIQSINCKLKLRSNAPSGHGPIARHEKSNKVDNRHQRN